MNIIHFNVHIHCDFENVHILLKFEHKKRNYQMNILKN